ncbi:MAG TPA: APC family permease [Methanoregulaceae archaeon]|nr:APC family permease [Methanoregulaceae archaeon]
MTEGTYKRSLGQLELVSLGIGGTIGSGIFVVPGIAAGIMGPGSLIAWVIVAISATLVMISIAWAASRFGRKGTFFAIFNSIFGRKLSTVLVILYAISALLGVATIASGVGQYISYFSIGNLLIIELLILAIFCIINLIGISVSGLTENILTLLKILPLVVITFALLPFIKPENFAATVPFTFASLFSTIIIVYWPFTGFEISAIPVDEMRDPRMVARSLGIVMFMVTAIYLLLNIALIGSTGSALLAVSPAPVATAAAFMFPHAGYLVAVIGIFAMLSAMNAYIIASSRVLHTIATEYSVRGLNHLNSNGTPGIALVTCCAVTACMLFLSNEFSTLAILSVITTLVPYIFFCIGAFFLFHDTGRRIISGLGAMMSTGILVLFFLYH